MEFVLVGPDGQALPSDLWAQYGLAGVLEYEGFVRDVTEAATSSGVAIEQFHPEYGVNQFEISLTPQSPVEAADQLVLMRIIIGRVARRYGLRVSLSPVPFAGSVGSGSHQHFSLLKDDTPLFSDGTGVGGMTPEGESAVAGLLAGLPDAQGVLCGSILSGLRMQPGHWSGAYVCWGTENREAAVRFLIGGPSNPHGANVEVKVIDPSANPYFASAAILGLALDGIERRLPLPPETTVDPATLTDEQRTDAGIVLLPTTRPRCWPRSTNPRCCVAFSAIRPWMPWWRCAVTSRRTSPTWPPTNSRRSSACRGACDMSGASALGDHVDTVTLIDHHAHGCWLQSGDRQRFENGLNEANVEPLADFDSAFDSQLGFAVRAHCAPLLGMSRHADPDAYWDRRSEHSECNLARLFLPAANVSDWLVDTGFAGGVADPATMEELSGGRAHEIVRLESVAEEAARCRG